MVEPMAKKTSTMMAESAGAIIFLKLGNRLPRIMPTTIGRSRSFSTTRTRASSQCEVMPAVIGRSSGVAREKTRMETIITTKRKLVPQRGCRRVILRAFSTVRGSLAS